MIGHAFDWLTSDRLELSTRMLLHQELDQVYL